MESGIHVDMEKYVVAVNQEGKTKLMLELDSKKEQLAGMELAIASSDSTLGAKEKKELRKLKTKVETLTIQVAAFDRLKEIYNNVQSQRGGRSEYNHKEIARKAGTARVTISALLNGHLGISRKWLIFFSKEFETDPRKISPEMVDADNSIIHAVDEELISELSGMSHEEKELFRELIQALKNTPQSFRESILGAAKSFNS